MTGQKASTGVRGEKKGNDKFGLEKDKSDQGKVSGGNGNFIKKPGTGKEKNADKGRKGVRAKEEKKGGKGGWKEKTETLEWKA